MACNITTGRERFCCSQVGGIKNAYMAAMGGAQNDVITKILFDNAGVVQDVQAGGGSVEFWKFDLDRQLSSFNQTIVTGAGGSVAYQMDIELHMSNDSELSWLKMQELTETLMYVILEDNNGVYYLLGAMNGMECSGGTYGHGGDAAYTDYVGYVLNFTGTELRPAYNMSTTSPFKQWNDALLEVGSAAYSTCQA